MGGGGGAPKGEVWHPVIRMEGTDNNMVETMARKVAVEVELPEGVELEDLLKGVKYRVLGERAERRRKILEEYTGILGEASSRELDEIAGEAWNA